MRLVRRGRDGTPSAGQPVCARRGGPCRSAIRRAPVPVLAAQVDDPAMVQDHVPHVVSAVRRRRVHIPPRTAPVGADRQSTIGADVDVVGIGGVDRDPERRGFFPPHLAVTEVARRRCRSRLCPGAAGVGAYADTRPAVDAAIVERGRVDPVLVPRIHLDVPRRSWDVAVEMRPRASGIRALPQAAPFTGGI